MRNHSYGNLSRPQVHFQENQTHFLMKGFARRLVLKQRHKITGKWPPKKDKNGNGSTGLVTRPGVLPSQESLVVLARWDLTTFNKILAVKIFRRNREQELNAHTF